VADLDRLVVDIAIVIIEGLLLVEAVIGGLVVVPLIVMRLVVAAVVIAATVAIAIAIAIASLRGSGASAEGGRRESECDEGLTHDHLLEAA
jgi:heme A synthase